MKKLQDYLGERFVTNFVLTAVDPAKSEATIRFFNQRGELENQDALHVDMQALDLAINESIVSVVAHDDEMLRELLTRPAEEDPDDDR